MVRNMQTGTDSAARKLFLLNFFFSMMGSMTRSILPLVPFPNSVITRIRKTIINVNCQKKNEKQKGV